MGIFDNKNNETYESNVDELGEKSLNKIRHFGHRFAKRATETVDHRSEQMREWLNELDNALQDDKLDPAALRKKLRQHVNTMRSDVDQAKNSIVHELNEALHDADAFARRNPWQTIGAAAGIALVIGFLAGRS